MPTYRYQHIIWDWNGTLLDDTQAGLNAVNAMLGARNLPLISLSSYRELFGFPVKDFYRTIGFQLENENWDAMAHEFHDCFLKDTTISLHAQSITAIHAIRHAGIRQSVLSASEQSILTNMLNTFEISHLFEHVLGTNNLYGNSKLALGKKLLQTLNLPPPDVLLIGDSLHDHEVATALGTDCLLISHGHQSHKRLIMCGAPVLESLADIPAWLTHNREPPLTT